MDTFEAISGRRSIRKFHSDPIPRADIEKILLAGTQAPSAKNRQPWRFVVVEGAAKAGMLSAMRKGMAREKAEPKMPEIGRTIAMSGGEYAFIRFMEEAPVSVFIINPENEMGDFTQDWEARFYEVANLQSVGACIQNMLLAATSLGYGTLWICDIFYPYEEVAEWLGTSQQVVAAVSFGVPAQAPGARPRRPLEDIVEWRNR